MTEADERSYIASALDTLQRVSGSRPTGWHGPEYGQSERTPALLAELGIDYVLDWPNDEQPFLMRTPSRPLVALAMALELDDVITMWHRRVSAERWRQAIAEALDQLLADGAQSSRHLILNLHPWLIGHPASDRLSRGCAGRCPQARRRLDRERVGDCRACATAAQAVSRRAPRAWVCSAGRQWRQSLRQRRAGGDRGPSAHRA